MTLPVKYRRIPNSNQQANYTNMPWTRAIPGVCEAYQYSGNIQTPGWPAYWAVPLAYDADGNLFVGAIVGRQPLTTGTWLIAVDARMMKFVTAPAAEFLSAYQVIVPPAPLPPPPTPIP